MSIFELFLIFGSLCVIQIDFLEGTYQCGIRKNFIQLVHHGWKVEDGQWPWHTAVFHKTDNGSFEYACGGTLIDQKHILTAAHCAVNRNTLRQFPADRFELHFGQQNLSKVTDHTQIRDVIKVHVHHQHSTHRSDIALLVMRLAVEYTDYVIPICLDQRADIDLRNLEGQYGWITGWGTTQSGNISDVLRTASMPVVSYLQCFTTDPSLYGNTLNENVFCAGDRNGTSPGTGDSGGGMYFSEGDRWVIRGIVSFARAAEFKAEVDTSTYAVFVNVQRFLSWIREITDESKSDAAKRPKRISEIECDRFKSLARKRSNGLCANSRYPHTVQLIYTDGHAKCSGILINENHVITACFCVMYFSDVKPDKVYIDSYGEMSISNITCHPLHDIESFHHELAVVKLNTSINLTSRLIPACLASNWTENLYDTLIQTGFAKNRAGDIKEFIESDENQVLPDEECERNIQKTDKSRIGKLCVINHDPLKTSIWGAAGGPLQSSNSRTCVFTVVGVLTYAIVDSKEFYESNKLSVEIYTRVSYYLDWIEEIVWNVKSDN